MPIAPKLQLSVQYALDYQQQLPRWRIRRWIDKALQTVYGIYIDAHLDCPFQGVQLTVRFVDGDEMQALNHQFRDKDYATNVLTFEYGVDERGYVLSDVVVCIPTLEHEAASQQKTITQHAAHLLVHGVLHALGYDHLNDEDAEEMESLEADILAHFRIPNPYQIPSA